MAPDANSQASSWVPAQIDEDKAFTDKYLIEGELGRGGSGVVFCARHRELDERVAIKFLLPGPRTSSDLARFRSEARTAHRVKSEHVARIIDVSTTNGDVPYIVMEYLQGVDLERMLQRSPSRQLATRDAIDFILQACEAVAECHCLDIVHRDLKPSNLFCVHGSDGLPMIKVLDFGISKLRTGAVDTSTTGGCRVVGSPRYMSPEQFEYAADVDARADIWAIGVILYELVTGSVPFTETDVFRLRERIRTEEPRPMNEVRSDVPPALAAVVGRCLEKRRGNRYPNLAEFAKAMYPFATQRTRLSVARIVRIVEAPGCTTGSLPLFTHINSDSPTIVLNEQAGGSKRRRGIATALLAIGLTAASFAGRARFVRRAAPAGAEVDAAAPSPISGARDEKPLAVQQQGPPPAEQVAAEQGNQARGDADVATPGKSASAQMTQGHRDSDQATLPAKHGRGTQSARDADLGPRRTVPNRSPGSDSEPAALSKLTSNPGDGGSLAGRTVIGGITFPTPVTGSVASRAPSPVWIVEPAERRKPMPPETKP
jgi:serine/threonine protein kinase